MYRLYKKSAVLIVAQFGLPNPHHTVFETKWSRHFQFAESAVNLGMSFFGTKDMLLMSQFGVASNSSHKVWKTPQLISDILLNCLCKNHLILNYSE